MLSAFLERCRNYLQKRRQFALWKEERCKKWLSEGRAKADIRKALKLHKVKF